MAAWKLGPALANGCTVVLKPAEQTPLTALRLADLVLRGRATGRRAERRASFGETAGAALAAHPAVDKVAFTGSTEVGRLISGRAGQPEEGVARARRQVAERRAPPTPTSRPRSRAPPTRSSSTTDSAAAPLAAPRRVPVSTRRRGHRRAARADQDRTGMDPATETGPLVSRSSSIASSGTWSRAREGARAVTGGKRIGERGYFVAPTVLATRSRPCR